MLILTEEYFVAVFEDQFNFNSDSQHNHWHNKSNKYFFVLNVFLLVALLDLRNRDEQLLCVILVKWKGIQMSKDLPVS